MLATCYGRPGSIRGVHCLFTEMRDVSQRTVAFLDTSIHIARIIHSPETKRQIEGRLRTCELTTTGLIARQEFKRRLLKDARYLLDLFLKYKSFARVHRHVVDVLPPHHRRKQQISLEILATLMEEDSDEELAERAVLLLRGLLRDGLYEFDESVGHVISKSQCGCAGQEIRQRGKRYEFGEERCSKIGKCGVLAFLESVRPEIQRILALLESLPEEDVTIELDRAINFGKAFLDSPERMREHDPCKTVGDLLIALESSGIPVFYTMNGKESQHLCRALDQSLVVRPSNPSKSDIECPSHDAAWPKF